LDKLVSEPLNVEDTRNEPPASIRKLNVITRVAKEAPPFRISCFIVFDPEKPELRHYRDVRTVSVRHHLLILSTGEQEPDYILVGTETDFPNIVTAEVAP
jgi:hypothetical protein